MKRERVRKNVNFNQSTYAGSSFVDGNTVRRLEAVPNVQPDKRSVPKKKQSRQVAKNQEKALHMNGLYVFALAIAVIVTLIVCVQYLQVQAEITYRLKNIHALEVKLTDITSQNDELDNRINSYIDLDNIYKVATEELGMSYATQDQISLYENSGSEYVRQYQDIPEIQTKRFSIFN